MDSVFIILVVVCFTIWWLIRNSNCVKFMGKRWQRLPVERKDCDFGRHQWMPRAERGMPKRTLHQHFWLLHVCMQRGLSFRQQRSPVWRQKRVLGKWGQSLRWGRFVRQHRRQFWVLLSGKLLPSLHCHFLLISNFLTSHFTSDLKQLFIQ